MGLPLAVALGAAASGDAMVYDLRCRSSAFLYFVVNCFLLLAVPLHSRRQIMERGGLSEPSFPLPEVVSDGCAEGLGDVNIPLQLLFGGIRICHRRRHQPRAAGDQGD